MCFLRFVAVFGIQWLSVAIMWLAIVNCPFGILAGKASRFLLELAGCIGGFSRYKPLISDSRGSA